MEDHPQRRTAGLTRARLHEAGWNADLAVESADFVPSPSGNEVVVSVEACGVCHRDCIDRAGRFAFMSLPITPGHEAVGHVIAVGPDVRDWRVGDRVASMHRDWCGECVSCEAGEMSLCKSAASVLGLLRDGGYATHLVAPERCFYAMPEGIEPALAAIFHCTLGTAYRGLSRFGRVGPGMRVLVTGANGGVGAAAVQIARRLGAEVVGVVRREADAGFVRELGAEVVVDDTGTFHKKLPGGAVDVAMDCVGQPTFNASLRSLAVGGRMIAVGNVVELRVEMNIGYVITMGIEIAGSSGATPGDMERLLEMHQDQPFTMPIHAALPLQEADRAQRMVLAGGLRGRVVLVPEE